ncbi:MAG: hypothetical protein OXB93_05120, partial [Cytophagales bacterium]|nr:hypothetical protein [Cytophagales bacterium]
QFFHPLSHGLGKEKGGRLAMILPFSLLTASKGLPTRKYLADHWHIEQVITSHDFARPFFSGATGINECLVIGRRKQEGEKIPPPTQFISLSKNPSEDWDAVRFLYDLEKGKVGDWGQRISWPAEFVENGDWTPAAFYSSELSRCLLDLPKDAPTIHLNDIARIQGTRAIRRDQIKNHGLAHAKKPQPKRALKSHDMHIHTMLTESDTYLEVIRGEEEKGESYFKRKSAQLFICYGWNSHTQAITTVRLRNSVMADQWHPIQVKGTEHREEIERALCAWFNSTLGALGLLSVPSKTMQHFLISAERLRGLHVPDVRDSSIREPLAAVQKAYEKSPLKVLKDA